MRGIVFSLAAVSGLGAALVGGGAIASGPGGPADSRPTAEATTGAAPTTAAGPVYYGGRLAPIVVVAAPLPPRPAPATQDCPRLPG